MVKKFIISGRRGSFITTRKDAKKHFKIGDFTNNTGTIKKVTLVKKSIKGRKVR